MDNLFPFPSLYSADVEDTMRLYLSFSEGSRNNDSLLMRLHKNTRQVRKKINRWTTSLSSGIFIPDDS